MVDQPDMGEVWTKLSEATSPGTHQLRLDPHINFNATVTNPGGAPGLYLRTATPLTLDPGELVGSEQVLVTVKEVGTTGASVQLTLAHETYREMFDLLVADL